MRNVMIKPGTYSRTGKTYGNVDEGRGVRVSCGAYTEFLFAPERFDETVKNRIGRLGAFVDQMPHQSEIDAAVERARTHVGATTTVRKTDCRPA